MAGARRPTGRRIFRSATRNVPRRPVGMWRRLLPSPIGPKPMSGTRNDTVASTREGALTFRKRVREYRSGRLRGIFSQHTAEGSHGNDERPRSRNASAPSRRHRPPGTGRDRRRGCTSLLVLGAPLIVRYGPEPEVAAAVAASPSRGRAPRCAYAPESAARATAHAAPTAKALRVVRAVACPSHQHALDAAGVRLRARSPPSSCSPSTCLRDLDHDVVGLRARVVLEPRQALQARRARGQHLDLARRSRRRAACPRPCAFPLPCGSAPGSKCPAA